jgi:hypothetical protein
MGVRAQQAANLAARIQGQERVSGGRDAGQISQMNIEGGASAYGHYKEEIRVFLQLREGEGWTASPPTIRLGSDEVRVTTRATFPSVAGFEAQDISLEANAYGGEDTYMYGLPRWGSRAQDGRPYWQYLMSRIRPPANAQYK